jgi:lipopolysaccharide/colanic/teichoic acid biosynthesis glycosyltransferase
VLIKLDSKGPMFFKQERVGLDGKTFFAYKLRSMRVDAELLSGPVWATENDPRVTRVGRILRKLRLDELPQLWNVMRGDMSFVGPRPERPHFVEMLEQHIPYYALRHSVPPGITGWAQVCASYGSDIGESRVKLEFDLFYLKNQSPLFDALIMLKTVKIALFGRGAR